MRPEFDLSPAADALTQVVVAIDDDRLDSSTPAAMPVRALLEHIDGLAEAFRAAASKETIGGSAAPESGSGVRPGWRVRIPQRLAALARAWCDPAAWDGETEAGGVAMPAAVTARVALDELVVHCWDLGQATGREMVVRRADLEILLSFLRDTPEEGTPGLFGPVVPVSERAPLLHRVLGLTGRDAFWMPHRM
ncbi:TIGR03086 family metal-binding protein [Nocardia sp. X0981]